MDKAAPLVGAFFVKVTVQVLDPFGPRLAGLQAIFETSTGALRLMEEFAELLPYEAVTVAL